jgi:hypothetical protein
MLCMLKCITESIQVTDGNMLVSPRLVLDSHCIIKLMFGL